MANPLAMRSNWPRVLKAMVERSGSLTAAASEVGISRRQLIRLLKGKCMPREKTQRMIEEACDRFRVNASDLPGSRNVLALRTSRTGPAIAAVSFRCARSRGKHAKGRSKHPHLVIVKGSGFGAPLPNMPFAGLTDRLRIANHSQLGFGEYGYIGDYKKLRYERWSEGEIVVKGFIAKGGDAVTLALWDEQGRGATWGGNVTPCPDKPKIDKVVFSGHGKNLRITVHGSGFGETPVAMPFRGNLDCFSFTDFRSHNGASSALFGAGSAGFDRHAPHRVSLRYRLWTDSRIDIDGFSGKYGRNGAIARVGDPVTISVWNSQATSADDPQTAWGGRIVAVYAAPRETAKGF